MAGPRWLECCGAGQSGGSFTKERVRGQWSQLDCRSTPSGGPVKRLSPSQGLKKALGEVARCWRGLHPGGTWHRENSASRAAAGGKRTSKARTVRLSPLRCPLGTFHWRSATLSAGGGERRQAHWHRGRVYLELRGNMWKTNTHLWCPLTASTH